MEKQRVVEFLVALYGKRGELDAWIECNNEKECKQVMLAAMDMVAEACAMVCDAQADESECPERALYCAECIRADEWKKYMEK